MLKSLENHRIFSKLTYPQLNRLIDMMRISYYKSEDILINKGISQNAKIIIIIEGSLKLRKNNQLIAQKGQVLGDPEDDKCFEDDIILQTDGVIAEVMTKTVYEQFNKSLLELIEINMKKQEVKLKKGIRKHEITTQQDE